MEPSIRIDSTNFMARRLIWVWPHLFALEETEEVGDRGGGE